VCGFFFHSSLKSQIVSLKSISFSDEFCACCWLLMESPFLLSMNQLKNKYFFLHSISVLLMLKSVSEHHRRSIASGLCVSFFSFFHLHLLFFSRLMIISVPLLSFFYKIFFTQSHFFPLELIPTYTIRRAGTSNNFQPTC
jgi:hypothetical protein